MEYLDALPVAVTGACGNVSCRSPNELRLPARNRLVFTRTAVVDCVREGNSTSLGREESCFRRGISEVDAACAQTGSGQVSV